MKITFTLVGKCDRSNPSAIPIEIIKEWESKGLIKYLGESQNIRSIIAQSSCIVLPSYREGIPRSLLEAMSMGKPIITTDSTGCRECIKNPKTHGEFFVGENGIMAKLKNVHSLTQALAFFLSLSEEKREQMGKSGREYVLQRFDVSITIKAYKRALQNCKGNTLVFISNSSFGMSNFRNEVLKSLQDDGYTIHIIAPKDNSTQQLIDSGFHFHPIKINSKGLNPIEDFSTFLHLYKLLKKISPNFVFNYTIKPVIYGCIACNLLFIPNIAITTGLGYVFIQEGFKKRILRNFVCKLYKFALKQTSEVWFLNRDDQETFLSFKIIQSSKARLLDSEGVDPQYFFPQISQDKSEITITLIARMLWDKGVGEFIEAIKECYFFNSRS